MVGTMNVCLYIIIKLLLCVCHPPPSLGHSLSVNNDLSIVELTLFLGGGGGGVGDTMRVREKHKFISCFLRPLLRNLSGFVVLWTPYWISSFSEPLLNVLTYPKGFYDPENHSIDTSIMSLGLIICDLWPFLCYGGHFGRHLGFWGFLDHHKPFLPVTMDSLTPETMG